MSQGRLKSILGSHWEEGCEERREINKRVTHGTSWPSRSGFWLPFLFQLLWRLSLNPWWWPKLTTHLLLCTFESCVLSMSHGFLSSPVFHLWKPIVFGGLILTGGPSTVVGITPSQFSQQLSQIDIISTLFFFFFRWGPWGSERLHDLLTPGGGEWSPEAIALSPLNHTRILLVPLSLLRSSCNGPDTVAEVALFGFCAPAFHCVSLFLSIPVSLLKRRLPHDLTFWFPYALPPRALF